MFFSFLGFSCLKQDAFYHFFRSHSASQVNASCFKNISVFELTESFVHESDCIAFVFSPVSAQSVMSVYWRYTCFSSIIPQSHNCIIMNSIMTWVWRQPVTQIIKWINQNQKYSTLQKSFFFQNKISKQS